MSALARAELSRGARIGIVVAAVAIVVGAVVLLPPPGPAAVVPTPSPTASPSASPTPTPTASPTPTPSPTPSPTPTSPGRYVNSVLGYSVQLPPPWRRSTCLSGGAGSQVPGVIGGDAFTSVPAVEESIGIGALHGTASVVVERNPNGLSAEAWASSPRFAPPDRRTIEPTTLDGRAGVRVVESGIATETTIVPVDDLMYVVGFTAQPGDPKITALRAIIASFAFVPRSPAPTATPRAPRSAEAVADALAAGFAARDAAGLANLMGDCLINGVEQGGLSHHSPEQFTAALRDLFAAGTSVAVRARPIEPGPEALSGTFSVATTWTDPGQAPARIDLIIAADGPFHYWRGMIKRLQAP